MLNRRTVLATGAIAAVPLTTSLGALAQGRKDAVTLAMTLEPPGLDPTAGAASAIAEIVQYNIFETLTKINPDGSVSPLLAESWEVSPDLKTYTFKLRRGVKFQNGEPFTAAAVKFSYDRAGGEKSTNKDKRTFAGITTQVVDDYTVVLLNKEIDPDLLFILGQATSIIVEPKSADTNANKPVGTGPYQLQAWNKGSSVVLTAWDGYRDAKAIKIKRATFRFISDPAAQVAALLAGDVDAFPRVTPRSVPQFKTNPKFQVVVSGSRAKTILAINNGKKPLDDVRVRRAMNMAIDRKAIVQRIMDGMATPAYQYMPDGMFGALPQAPEIKYDPEGAKKLLAEAGYPNGFEVGMNCPNDRYVNDGNICQAVAANLARVGVKVNLQAETKGTYFPKILRRDTSFYMLGWTPGTYDSHNALNALMRCVDDSGSGQFNLGAYCNPKVDELTLKIQSETDQAKRNAMIKEAFDLHAADVGHIPLHQQALAWGVNKNVKLVQLADNFMPFKWMSINK